MGGGQQGGQQGVPVNGGLPGGHNQPGIINFMPPRFHDGQHQVLLQAQQGGGLAQLGGVQAQQGGGHPQLGDGQGQQGDGQGQQVPINGGQQQQPLGGMAQGQAPENFAQVLELNFLKKLFSA